MTASPPTLAEDGIIEASDGQLTLIRIVPETTAVGYGTDLKCVNDLDPALATTNPNSTETLAQDCYHRITTRRETLPDDPDYGIDVTEFLHAAKTLGDLQGCQGQIATELQKDDRVANALAVVTYDATRRRLEIDVRVTPKDPDLGPFSLIVVVTDGATLLQQVTS
jgi:hypothetical protein